MGWFSRTSSPATEPPRWAAGLLAETWPAFVEVLRTCLHEYELTLDDRQLAAGRVELPVDAVHEYWDLHAVAVTCREDEPQTWAGHARAALAEAVGRPSERAEQQVRNAEVATLDRAEQAERRAQDQRASLCARLRAQLFSATYFGMMDRDAIACRPFGDAWLAIVEDLGGSEVTVRRSQLADLGITVDEAFALATEQGAAICANRTQMMHTEIEGASCDILVSNDFFLSALAIRMHSLLDPGVALVAVALTWHHWILATLAPTATRMTLVKIAELANELAKQVSVTHAEWIGTSLWWWPSAAEPVAFTLDSVPEQLAARLA